MDIVDRSRVNGEFWLPALVGSALVTYFVLIPSYHNMVGHWHSATWSNATGRVVVAEKIKSRNPSLINTLYRFEYTYQANDRR